MSGPAKTIPRLGLGAKTLYGVGEIANAMKSYIFGLFTFFFYTTVMGLPGTLMSVATAISLVWVAVIDPYIGYFSDNARLKWGRRHSFMLVGASTMGVSFWLFFAPPKDLSTWAVFTWLLLTGLLIRTMNSIYNVPYYALGAELSDDYHERTSITAVRGACAVVGTFAAVILAFVFFPGGFAGEGYGLDKARYSAMGLAFGVMMTVVGLIATFGTFRYRPYLHVADVKETSETPKNFFKSFVASLRIHSFRLIFISYSLFFLGTVINATLAIHYLTLYVGISSSKAMSYFWSTFFVGALVGVAFWLWTSKRMEKRWLYFIATLTTGVVMSGAYFLFGEGHLFGTGNLTPLLVGHGLAGFFASVLWVLPGSMIADAADEDALATGQRREGSLFGLYNFGQQIAAGLSLVLTGVLSELYAGLVAGQIEQSAETVHRIGVLYGLLPAGLLVASAFIILRYSLDQKSVSAIQAALAENARPHAPGPPDPLR